MLASIQDATPVVCGAAFTRQHATVDENDEAIDFSTTPLSLRRALISVVSYLLLLTDVPRTSSENGSIHGTSMEPNVYLVDIPTPISVLQFTQSTTAWHATSGNTSVQSLPVAAYKTSPSAAAVRGYVYNRNLWPPCLDYATSCGSDAIAVPEVVAFWNRIIAAAAAAPAPRAFQGVNTTLKYALRVQDDRLDRIYDYIAFQFVDLTAYRSIWVSYMNASVASLCAVHAIGRPLFCSKSWASQAGVSVVADITARAGALQAQYPQATIDVFIAESEADPARRHGGFAYVGFSAFDTTTVLRAVHANVTVALDEVRYAGSRIWSNIGSWTSYTQGFRSIGQAYMGLRLLMLFLGCYVATDGDKRAAMRAMLSVPSQVVVYGSWFPVLCYAVAHLIDAPVTYTATEQLFSTASDFVALPFSTMSYILAVRLRCVWVLALLLKLFSFLINIGVWHPNGTIGLRGHLVALLCLLALLSMFQLDLLRDVPVRAVFVVEPSTIIALYMSEVFTDMNNRLSGFYHDTLSVAAAFLLLVAPLALGVQWWRHHHNAVHWRRHPLFFGKTKAPFAAAKLWSSTAMTMSWGDGVLDVDPVSALATVPLPRSEGAHLDDLFRADHDTSTKHILMNIVHMSDPITFLWLSSGSLVVYEYGIVTPTREKKRILHPFTKDDIVYHCYDIARDELTLQDTLLTKDISWRRLVRCY
ncbi:hypothetical protein SPRG_05957 [Saprolegnia parasitica CBS 223.65]|uniref:Transmembrane protein n=1 Tax=Saprolegnia parasitica (strain CBS 223.65) TaxID=695850 RepID=A0A067CJP3_SAPPC|nr:hypothetical protein SPRG_05957 [Saprolegnia parasitica CBS 223.65]KDO29420.1 hypothetical protein SPRG_05957 [Saprolegnia parasitica CBS 223.65]|eukprot:XP_012199922.1 hypothetical protein SPRG_05957 [Saprolegnia parasitica CBS 223.65]